MKLFFINHVCFILCCCFLTGLRTGSFSDFISLQEEHAIHDIEEDCIDDTHSVDLRDMPIVSETTGSTSIDRILLQHLLHCEFLLQVRIEDQTYILNRVFCVLIN